MIEELQSGQRNKLGLLIIKQKKLNSENKQKALGKRKTLGRVIYPQFFLLDDKNDMLKFV